MFLSLFEKPEQVGQRKGKPMKPYDLTTDSCMASLWHFSLPLSLSLVFFVFLSPSLFLLPPPSSLFPLSDVPLYLCNAPDQPGIAKQVLIAGATFTQVS